ncbi:MAG: RNase adapter RapZ [Coriobacteriia bacterium]|nr:RNase adapter RapZ [Coriobacteriia bacterium]
MGEHIETGGRPADATPADACPLLGPEVVVITGMSGAGRTEALHAMEDLGYYCIDNLPPSMLVPLSELIGLPNGTGRHLAVVCDVRSQEFFSTLSSELRKITERGVSCQVLFLDADDDALRNRYSSLRRRHPLARGGMTVSQAIAAERQRLSSIRELANVVVDTSTMRARDLRARIAKEFSGTPAQQGMNVAVSSFGFKYGLPLDADLVIDVRFLPNPFYDPTMRELTGFDAPVRDYVLNSPETKAFLEAWHTLLDVVMPGYVSEGKQHLSIAIGCTGGQHRSVTLAEATGAYLASKGYRVSCSHRDVARSAQGGAQS